MKLAIVTPSRDNATIFYRVYLPVRYWTDIEPVYYPMPSEKDKKISIEDFCNAVKEDVVLIHRVSRVHAIMAQYFRTQMDKRIIFDTDDQEYNLPRNHHLRAMYPPYETKEYLDVILKSADEAWVTTNSLRRDMSKMTAHNIEIIPNAVDVLDPVWHFRADNNKALVNIGWVGGVSHLPDLEFCIKGLKKLIADDVDFKLTLCGMPKEQYDLVTVGDKKVKKELPYEKRYETLVSNLFNFIPEDRLVLKFAQPLDKYPYFYKDMDIVIAPLAPNAFNNCKSELKILEAGVRKLPAVVSKESKTYSDFAWNNKDTIFAVNNYASDWSRALRKLIESKDLRDARGNATYDAINKKYNLTYWSKYREQRVKDVFNNIQRQTSGDENISGKPEAGA